MQPDHHVRADEARGELVEALAEYDPPEHALLFLAARARQWNELLRVCSELGLASDPARVAEIRREVSTYLKDVLTKDILAEDSLVGSSQKGSSRSGEGLR
jgi:hypothetical protein